MVEMKYRLDSVRKNRTRLRRKFITTPPKKKKPIQRKRKSNWLFPLLVFVAWLSLVLGIIYLATRHPTIEHRSVDLLYQPMLPLVPPLPKEEKPKPRILGKDSRYCYPARSNGGYYNECNWVCKGKFC